MASSLPGIGSGIQAVGTIFSGIAQGGAANYQAQVAKNNATIANQNAVYATQAGSEQSQITSLKAASTAGQIKAAQGANNIDIGSGSAVKVQESQKETGELDTLTAMNNAALQAYGYQSQALSDTAQAGLYSAEATEAPVGAALSATGNLLSNASSNIISDLFNG